MPENWYSRFPECNLAVVGTVTSAEYNIGKETFQLEIDDFADDIHIHITPYLHPDPSFLEARKIVKGRCVGSLGIEKHDIVGVASIVKKQRANYIGNVFEDKILCKLRPSEEKDSYDILSTVYF